MGTEKDISIDPSISIKKSQVKFIDKYRVGHGYSTRSQYFQWLVTRDLKYNRLEAFGELMGLLIMPMMGFFFFMLLAILTRGVLFYLFMGIFGIFGVMLSVIYYAKKKRPKGG